MDILVFDVNETLLDLHPLDDVFADILGDAAARHEWFTLLLERAFTASLTGAYRNFGELSRSALHMVASKRRCSITEAQAARVSETMRSLPAHPEVRDALSLLCDEGFTLTALTQSPMETLEAQLAHAGLDRFFSRLFSADTVKRYKPAPEPYRMVAQEMQCETAHLRLIAAHGWDIEGAMQAGCKAAFVGRSGQVMDPGVPQPDIVGADLDEIATEILGSVGGLKA